MHPVATATIEALRAFVFPADGRKSKPPASRLVVDSEWCMWLSFMYNISKFPEI
jgi:hypothetical protein